MADSSIIHGPKLLKIQFDEITFSLALIVSTVLSFEGGRRCHLMRKIRETRRCGRYPPSEYHRESTTGALRVWSRKGRHLLGWLRKGVCGGGRRRCWHPLFSIPRAGLSAPASVTSYLDNDERSFLSDRLPR